MVNHRIQHVLGHALQLRGDADLCVRVGCRAPALTLVAHPANRQLLQPARGNQLRQVLLRQVQSAGTQVLVRDRQLRGTLTAGGTTLNARQQAGNMLVNLLARTRSRNEQAVGGIAVLVHAITLHADGAGAARRADQLNLRAVLGGGQNLTLKTLSHSLLFPSTNGGAAWHEAEPNGTEPSDPAPSEPGYTRSRRSQPCGGASPDQYRPGNANASADRDRPRCGSSSRSTTGTCGRA